MTPPTLSLRCPGCGQTSKHEAGISVTADPVAVPAEGPVLFLLRMPLDGISEDQMETMIGDAQGLVEALAPGRSQFVAVDGIAQLDVLGAEELARLGLQRIPDAPA